MRPAKGVRTPSRGLYGLACSFMALVVAGVAGPQVALEADHLLDEQPMVNAVGMPASFWNGVGHDVPVDVPAVAHWH